MSQTSATKEVNMNGYNLIITTRDCGDTPHDMEELTYRTIKAWLWIAGRLEQQVYELPLDAETGDLMGSVEDRYVAEMWETDHDFALADAWGDSRVTIWNSYRSQLRTDFHLNSDDIPQVAINIWLAQRNAIERVLAETPQNAVKSAQDAPNSSATPPQGNNVSATTKASNTPQPPQGWQNPPVETYGNGLYTKKDAIVKLSPGSSFKLKIVQIKKRSTDGKDFYEFYEPYGGKPGDFSAVSVFTDNEIALNNGLIAYLDTLGIKVGQAITGEWIANASVGKPKTKTIKGEEKTFTNIYVNSFEGQPERETGDRHPGMADDLPQG